MVVDLHSSVQAAIGTTSVMRVHTEAVAKDAYRMFISGTHRFAHDHSAGVIDEDLHRMRQALVNSAVNASLADVRAGAARVVAEYAQHAQVG